ncbi:MAG: hypothetical protein KIT62_17920 [Cyclobacteriaceae bacterium]|nr:hypothetical protein [Cyclobacteriaceae bacterium]
MMKKKSAIFYVFIALLLMTVFVLRKSDLTIHIIAETSAPMSSIRLQIDDETLFDGEVDSGVYFGKKIVVENMGMGFHSLKIEALQDSIIYKKDSFFLFNRTMIITYFDKSSSEKSYFVVWNKFGEFLPD